jgi:hypothetical protein
MVTKLRFLVKQDWRFVIEMNREPFLPLPPGEADAQRRVRESGVSVIAFPSSPTLLPDGEGRFSVGLQPTLQIPRLTCEGCLVTVLVIQIQGDSNRDAKQQKTFQTRWCGITGDDVDLNRRLILCACVQAESARE